MALTVPGDGDGEKGRDTFEFANRTRSMLNLPDPVAPSGDDALLKLQQRAAQKTKAEQAARILKMQFKTGLGEDLIGRKLDEVEADAAKADFDAAEYRKNNPKLAQWLSESPNHISLFGPDAVPMRDLDRWFRRVDDPTRPLLKSEMETMARTLAKGQAAQHMKAQTGLRERLAAASGSYADSPDPSGAPPIREFKDDAEAEETFYNEALAELAAENEYVSGMGPVGLGEALKRKPAQSYIPFLAGLDDTGRKLAIFDAAKAVETGSATPEQVILLSRFGRLASAEERRGKSFSALVGDIAAGLPSTVGEFALTAGAYRAGKGATEAFLKGAIRKALSGHAMRSGVRNAAGAVVGAGTQAAIIAAPRVPGDTAERMRVHGEEFGGAFLKAAGSQYVEVLSERTGYAAERLLGPLKQAVATRWLKLNPAAGQAGFLKRIAKAGGWNGVIGEVFEERVADVGRAAIGAEEFKFPTAEELAAEIVAFSIPGAPGAALQVLAPRQPRMANPEIMKVIGDTLAETQILEKLPQKAEEFVAVQTRGTDKEFTYIPVDSWVSLWQSQKDEKTGLPLDPRQMAADVLGNAEAFDQALEAGSDLKIPTPRYAVTLGANEKFKDLFQEELRFDPEELNAREQKELKERVQKAEEAVKAQEAEKKSPAVDVIEESADRVGQQIQQALEAAGFRKEAPSYAALVKQTFKRFGERLGVDPMQLFGQYGLTVERQAEPKPATAAAFEQPEATPPEGEKAPRGRLRIGNAKITIDLFQKADRSTFLHETGHFYLEMLGDIAAKPESGKEIGEDYKTVLEWLGVKDRAEITREHHERWARAFEQYLMEGKAPSKGLRRAFYRFREWLSSVYEAAKDYFAGVGLSDPVRKVMDRLLASKEEIEAAEQEAGIEPLIKDPKALGLSEEWADKYEEAIRDARRTAEDKLVSKLMEDVRREDESWYKAERERIREGVVTEVNAMREYVAVEALAQEGAQLDRAIVDDVFGPVTRKALPKRIVSAKDAKGVHPDHAADLYGFTSGDELIKTLSSLEDKDALIERLTNERMEAAYGKLLSPEQRREEALKLLHNEDRAKVLRMEMEALAKMRPGATKGLIRRIATRRKADASVKAEAAERIANTPIRDLKPGQYAAAERRAAREALDAALAGRWEEAVEAKEREILNNALYMATVEAKEEADAAVEFAAGFGRTSVREKLGKAGADYLEQVDGILERFNFKPVSLKEVDKRKRLAEWVKAREEEGIPVEIPDNILDEAFRKHYKDLTVAELRDIRDTLEHLKHLSNLKNRLLKNKAHRDLDEAITKAVASIEDNAKGVRKQEIETRLPGQEAKDVVEGFFADHRKYSNFARQLDGWKDGGIMWELLIRPANDAGDREAAMNEEATIKLMGLVNEWQKSTALKKHAQHIPQIERGLTREAMIAVALNWGTEDNRAKLLAGYKWTELQAEAILAKLGEADWKFVQGMWDFIDTYWQETRALSQRVTGLAPEKVDASPVQTPFGVFKGGYYPLKYDNKQSIRVDALTVADAAKEVMRGAHVRATTRHGFRKERVKGVKLPVRLDLGVVFQHVAEVIHDQTHFEFLIDTNKILREERLQEAIKRHYGKSTYDQLKKAVDSIAAGPMPAQNAVERAFNWLRVGASISKMGWNVMTALKQPLGLTQSMVRVGPKWILKGMQRWLGDASRMENTVKWVHERSEFMRLRAKTQEREINEVRNKVQQNPTLVPRPVAESYFWLITRGQMIADIPTWIGAYEKAMAEAPKANSAEDAKAQEERAAAMADQAVIDAQGGGQVKDLADFQRRSPMFKLWTTFYSYMNTTYNLTLESFAKTNYRDPVSIGRLFADLLMLYTVPAILSVALNEVLRGSGDDDESFAAKVARENLSSMAGTIMLGRELQGLINGFQGYEGPAGTQAIAEVTKAGKQVAQGELDEAALKAVLRAAGSVFHFPSSQLEKTGFGLWKLATGEESSPLAPLVGPSRKK